MRILVFQHIACEHPGALRDYLAADGVAWDAVELDAGAAIPDLAPYDALWVMGGPQDVWDTDENPWMIAEKAAIRRWVRELNRPFLGLCLGHQLLADALGGTCGPQRPPEIGILDVALTDEGKRDPVFGSQPETFKALQWHSVRVAQPPDGAVVLASSPMCRVQAMRVGRAWSAQFHIELTGATVGEWGCVPAYEAALSAAQGEGALARLQREAATEMAGFAKNSQALYQAFMAHAR